MVGTYLIMRQQRHGVTIARIMRCLGLGRLLTNGATLGPHAFTSPQSPGRSWAVTCVSMCFMFTFPVPAWSAPVGLR